VSYASQYTDALAAFLALQERRGARKEQIAAQVLAEGPRDNLGASLEHVVNGRLASDPMLKDIQAQMDRAVAEATMYGIGAIIRNLAFLAKEGKR
jgi:hypothetical protein